MANPAEEHEDTKAFDGFAAEPHGQPEKPASSSPQWAHALGVAAKDSDFGPIPSTQELLDQAEFLQNQALAEREPVEVSADRAARFIRTQEPDHYDARRSPEEGLRGSVWLLDQTTAVNFARAQGAFITAQNNFLKDQDTRKIASAQHDFIEAQAEVLAKFGVV